MVKREVKKNCQHRKRLYTHLEKMSDTIRKRRVTLYGHREIDQPALFILFEYENTGVRFAWGLQKAGICHKGVLKRAVVEKKSGAYWSFLESPKGHNEG